MSLSQLKEYLLLREKYITIYSILNQHNLPQDILQYITLFNDLNITLYHDFDKDIKSILNYVKSRRTLTPDAYDLLNYIIVVFINTIIRQSIVIMEYGRRKRITSNDIEYALGLYPLKNSVLINAMIQNGHDSVENVKQGSGSRATKADTLMSPPTVEKYIRLYLKPIDDKIKNVNKKYDWSMRDIQVEKNAVIYLTGVTDGLIEKILSINLKVINADDLLKFCEANLEIKSILLELFI